MLQEIYKMRNDAVSVDPHAIDVLVSIKNEKRRQPTEQVMNKARRGDGRSKKKMKNISVI